jgi:hypothetical protein
MTYRVLEWNYEEVNSIIAKLSNACLELRNTPALSTADTGSTHHATLSNHVTALNSTLSHMAWILNGIYLGLAATTEDFKCTDDAAADVMREIQRYNDEYNHKYTPPLPPGNTQITAVNPSSS